MDYFLIEIKISTCKTSKLPWVQFSSVAQLYLTLCDPHESQHARPPFVLEKRVKQKSI